MTPVALQRRTLKFPDFDALLAEVDHLHRAGYEKLRRWDLSQMLEHIGMGMKAAMRGSKFKAPWIVRMIAPLILKKILRGGRMRENVKVPRAILPGPSRDEAKAVEEFRTLVGEFRDFRGEMHPHPIFGKLDAKTWTDLTLIHAAHHLSFLAPKS
jgi:hypothetical protein